MLSRVLSSSREGAGGNSGGQARRRGTVRCEVSVKALEMRGYVVWKVLKTHDHVCAKHKDSVRQGATCGIRYNDNMLIGVIFRFVLDDLAKSIYARKIYWTKVLTKRNIRRQDLVEFQEQIVFPADEIR